jgi:hypothetical protein
MRHGHHPVVDHLAAVGDQVEVQGAGGVGDVPCTAERGLNRVQRRQSLAKIETGLDQRHPVQIGGLGWIGPGRRAPPAGALRHPHPGLLQRRQRRLQQGLRRPELAGEVRSEGDDHRLVAMLRA